MRVLARVVLGGAVIVAGAVGGTLAGQSGRDDLTTTDKFLRHYAELLRLVQDNTPRPVEAVDLVYGSVDGMLGLLDPHTNFLRPDAYAHMRERQQGSFHGIGVLISMRGGRVTVITPIEGTPAARLGLHAGDIIEAVDGVSTEGMDLDDAARRLRGPEGSKVRVTISRPGLAAPLDLTIERARVPTDSVRYAFMLDRETAYIRIGDFIRTTGDEVGRALERLQKDGAKRLVLDLRENPGGIVDSAVAVSSMLLEPGQAVFTTRGRTADSMQDYKAARDGLHFGGPLVVLVNRGSASAAEIVAGAVQDHDRGVLIGETTFGKGVVQTIYPVHDAALALTTAKYYTPSGRCIQRDFDSFFDYLHPQEGNGHAPAAPEAAVPTPVPNGVIFFTDTGRKVFGGGGITPDHAARLGEYSERVAHLQANSAFFRFAVSYLADKSDKAAAARAFTPGDDILAAFRARVVDEKWLPAKEMDTALTDAADRRDIQVGLRAEVLNAGASLSEGYRAFLDSDEQVQAALGLFDEAAKLEAKAQAIRSPGAKVAASAAASHS
jgi:carboxyl-terminal processing protease